MDNPNQGAQEAIIKVLVEDKRREFNETNSALDILRRTRRDRGGVGAPLQVPAHLKSAANGVGIVVTDADLRNDTPLPRSLTHENVGVKVEE